MGDVGRPLFQGGSLLRCAAFAVNRAFFHSPPAACAFQNVRNLDEKRTVGVSEVLERAVAEQKKAMWLPECKRRENLD